MYTGIFGQIQALCLCYNDFVSDFRDRRGGGGRDFKRRDFSRPQEMHKAICSNCGKECEVPFKPTGSKPVFCRDCFQANRLGDNRSGGRDNYQKRDFGDRANQEARPAQVPNYSEQFQALNTKLDKILNLLTEKEAENEHVHTADFAKEVQAPEVLTEVPILKKRKSTKKTV